MVLGNQDLRAATSNGIERKCHLGPGGLVIPPASTRRRVRLEQAMQQRVPARTYPFGANDVSNSAGFSQTAAVSTRAAIQALLGFTASFATVVASVIMLGGTI